MRTYSFTHTFEDGTRRTYTIEAENVTAALAIFRQKVKSNATE